MTQGAETKAKLGVGRVSRVTLNETLDGFKATESLEEKKIKREGEGEGRGYDHMNIWEGSCERGGKEYGLD